MQGKGTGKASGEGAASAVAVAALRRKLRAFLQWSPYLKLQQLLPRFQVRRPAVALPAPCPHDGPGGACRRNAPLHFLRCAADVAPL